MHTITQKIPLSFTEALQRLTAGECVGIQPEGVHGFVELYTPYWLTAPNSSKEMLRWAGTTNNTAIRTSEYLGSWFLVVEQPTNVSDLLDELNKESPDLTASKSQIVANLAKKLGYTVTDALLVESSLDDIKGTPFNENHQS